MNELGDSRRAKEIALQFVNDENLSDRIDRLLATTLARAGEYEVARGFLQRVEKASDRIEILGALAEMLDKHGRKLEEDEVLDLARHEVDGLFRDWLPSPGHDKDIEALTQLGESLIRIGRAYEGKEMFSRARRVIPERVEPLNQPVELAQLAQLGEREESEGLFSQALGTIIPTGSDPNGEDSQWERFDSRESAEIGICIAGLMARAGQIEKAYQLFQDAYPESLESGQDHLLLGEVQALRDLMNALGRDGRLDSPLKTALDLKDTRDRLDALSALAAGLSEAGRRDEAEKALQHARSPSLRNFDYFDNQGALERLVDALAHIGLFDISKQIAVAIDHQVYRDRSLLTLAQALARAGQFVKAGEVIKSIESDWYLLAASLSLAVEFQKAGRSQKASETINMVAADCVRKIDPDRTYEDKEALYGFMTVLSQTGSFGERVLSQLLDRIRKLYGRYSSTRILGESADRLSYVWAMGMAKAGRVDETQEAAAKVSKPHNQWESLTALIKALTDLGRFDVAKRLALEIRSEARGGALRTLGTAFARAGEFEGAREIAAQLPLLDQEGMLLALGIAQTQDGMVPEATASFIRVRDLVLRSDYMSDRGYAVKELAIALGQAARFEEAIAGSQGLSIDAFIEVICSWQAGCDMLASSAVEAAELCYSILAGALPIAGWVRSDWRKIDLSSRKKRRRAKVRRDKWRVI